MQPAAVLVFLVYRCVCGDGPSAITVVYLGAFVAILWHLGAAPAVS